MVLYKISVLKNVSKFTDEEAVIRRCSVKRKDVTKNLTHLTAKHLFRSLFFNKVGGWKPETFRSSHWRCSVKQGALKNFANFAGNNLYWGLFLVKLDIWCLQLNQRRLRPRCVPVKFAIILKKICACLLVNLFKERLQNRCFFSEFCELFRNSYFVHDLQRTNSETPVRVSLYKFVSLAA